MDVGLRSRPLSCNGLDAIHSLSKAWPAISGHHSMNRRPWLSWLTPVLGLLLLAGGLRFYRLGEWSLAGDETATFEEVDSLFQRLPAASNGQIDNLPRLIPLAHATLDLGYQAFGRSEWGCRVLPALLGTLNVGLFYLLV